MPGTNRQTQFKKFIFIATGLFLLVGGPLLKKPIDKLRGKGLNSRAWKASFIERRLPVPPGPREGWWGVKLGTRMDKEMYVLLPEKHIPEYFDIDASGFQNGGTHGVEHPHLLIIGGSVA